MRFLRADTEDLILETVHDGGHAYAILSHRWLAEEEEVTFADIVKSRNSVTDRLRAKAGWRKLKWCRQQVVRDGLTYIWADTACIDKSSSQELTESISAMFRWYEKAEVCYVYLHDIPDQEPPLKLPEGSHDKADNTRLPAAMPESGRSPTQEADIAIGDYAHRPSETTPLLSHRHQSDIEAQPNFKALAGWDREAFAQTEWFTRAWTLQEMIAPAKVRFYSKSWTLIGELHDMAAEVSKISHVHEKALTKERSLKNYSIAQRMSWAAHRHATKIEDQAYALLGIMDVAMVVNYGEGDRSFQRLQEELLRTSSDDSIFAFESAQESIMIAQSKTIHSGSTITIPTVHATHLLATSPKAFHGCHDIRIPSWRIENNQYHMVSQEISFRARTIRRKDYSKLFWGREALPEPIRRQAILQCCRSHTPSSIMVLNLVALPRRPTIFYVNADSSRTDSLVT